MKKRKIIFKNIIKNIYKGYIEVLKTTIEILKTPFVKILETLEELSHE